MRRLAGLCALALVLLAGVGAQAAEADLFGPIELLSIARSSAGTPLQAEDARLPAVSADGRYVAFVGVFGGVQGIWRRELGPNGRVEPVAPGDATMPSISESGRYISFTSNENERLIPGHSGTEPNVYIRDMEPAAGEAEYTLVSAVNGSEEEPSYTYTGTPRGEEGTGFGSVADARSAMSASGEKVVFITTAQSNLLGGGEPTPAGEVLVRNVRTKETTLVSAEYEPGAGWSANRPVRPSTQDGHTEYGAVFPGGEETPVFDPSKVGPETEQDDWLGASISADGKAVAWMGQDLGRQVRLLAHEQDSELPQFAEPLWRNIDAGPGAPIRRVTGGSDAESPACEASGEQEIPERFPSASDPCAGPFEHYDEQPIGLWGEKAGPVNFVPQLSANGEEVAFITGARELASGEIQFAAAEHNDDLYLVDMASGLTRVQALHRLTEMGGGSGEEELERSAKVVDYSVAANGQQVAFTTQRTQFPLGSLTFVSPIAAVPGMIELFDIDLENDTLTRVTHGYKGEGERSEQEPAKEQQGTDPYQTGQGAYAPSFSSDGNTLVFSSSADNLVYGDGNDAPDVFLVHRLQPVAGTVEQYVSPAPPPPALDVPWKLGLTAVSLANGSVRLYAEVPGAGSVSAQARGTVLVKRTVRAAPRSARVAHTTVTAVARELASAHAAVGAGSDGLVPLTLSVARPYQTLVSSGGGLSAIVNVTFTVPGKPVLRASLAVSFRRTERKSKAKGAAASVRAGARKRSHKKAAR